MSAVSTTLHRRVLAPMVYAEDVRLAKPNPEGFLRVLQITGIQNNEANVFEDSNSGIQAAKSAGLSVVAVSPEWCK